MQKKYPTNQQVRVLLAGSSQHSLWCVQALLASSRFQVVGVITPAPKPQGRSQELVPNALHVFAQEKAIPAVLVQDSLATVKNEVLELSQPNIDFLLVVDFGYLIPDWLLELPQVAPLNIHPSRLPDWRGSSPGQFVLLSGATHSTISLIKMDNQLDHGLIVSQQDFPVDPTWNASDYYTHAFQTITKVLPDLVLDFAHNPTNLQPQPNDSPTPLARKLKRQDGFVPFSLIQALQESTPFQLPPPAVQLQTPESSLSTVQPQSNQQHTTNQPQTNNSSLTSQNAQSPTTHSLISQLSSLHQTMFAIFCHNQSLNTNAPSSLGHYLCQIPLAFTPWPTLWTELPTKKGNLKMSILSCAWNNATNKLDLHQVHLAGQQPALWNQVKNILTQ